MLGLETFPPPPARFEFLNCTESLKIDESCLIPFCNQGPNTKSTDEFERTAELGCGSTYEEQLPMLIAEGCQRYAVPFFVYTAAFEAYPARRKLAGSWFYLLQ
jgi:hypothetical protein